MSTPDTGSDSPPTIPTASLPASRLDMVEACGRLAQSLGMARSVGEIYGLLYLSPQPMTLDDIVQSLGISKASVSTGARQLLSLGAARKVWVRAERKDCYEAVLDLGELARRTYENIFKTRLKNSEIHLTELMAKLDAEKGSHSVQDHAVMAERLERLRTIQSRIKTLLPFVERIFL
ncbi:MAG: hypothetical protein EXS28_01560 [Pedosphaera sp.]|nr:hypothetical protein [Pedosphaera sp.]